MDEVNVRIIVTMIQDCNGQLLNKLSLLIAHAVTREVVTSGIIVSKTLIITGSESFPADDFFESILFKTNQFC